MNQCKKLMNYCLKTLVGCVEDIDTITVNFARMTLADNLVKFDTDDCIDVDEYLESYEYSSINEDIEIDDDEYVNITKTTKKRSKRVGVRSLAPIKAHIKKSQLPEPINKWVKEIDLAASVRFAKYNRASEFKLVAQIVRDDEVCASGKNMGLKKRIGIIKFEPRIPVEEFARKGEWLYLLVINGRIVKLGGTTRLRAMFDLYNVFNANSSTLEQYGLGPNYLQPLVIMPGRLGKFGFQLDF